jgi:hypothetical protein
MPAKRLARLVHSRGDGLSSPCGGVVALRWSQDMAAIDYGLQVEAEVLGVRAELVRLCYNVLC